MKKKEMAPHEKHAKMAVLGHLKSMAEDMMKDHMGSMKHVSVASNSDEGLAEGLDKAKEAIVQQPSPDDVLDGEDSDHMVHDDVNEPNDSSHDPLPFSDDQPHDRMGGDMEPHPAEEDLKAKIAHLMALKKGRK